MKKKKEEENKLIDEKTLFVLDEKNMNLEVELKNVQSKLRETTKEAKDNQKKIMFLEKLIIEKENNEYHAHQKVRRLNKEKDKMVK